MTGTLSPARRRVGPVTVTARGGDALRQVYEGTDVIAIALDHASAVLAAEHPEHAEYAEYAVDPGDLRTAMHQAAFPDEDMSNRPEPHTVVPSFLNLPDTRPPSGRYRAAAVARTGTEAVGA